jgi:hypothetical protein
MNRFKITLGLFTSLFVLVCGAHLTQSQEKAAIVTVAKPDKAEYVKLSKPQALKFDELMQLEQTNEPCAKLAARLDKLLHTPSISNEAYLGGAKPNRPSSDALGPSRDDVEH